MRQNKFPPGWDEERVQSIIDYYENQTEDEAVAEDAAASQNEFGMLIEALAEVDAAMNLKPKPTFSDREHSE